MVLKGHSSTLPSSEIKNSFTNNWLFIFTCTLLFFCCTATTAQAQQENNDTTNGAQASTEPQWPDDSLGRRTPRGTVNGFIKAVAAENYERAAYYLDLDSKLQKTPKGARVAQALQRMLDHGGNIIPYSWISDQPSGVSDDNLGPNLDRVGAASVNGEAFDLVLEKKEDQSGAPLWLFSSQTVQRIPVSIDDEAVPYIERLLPTPLKENKWNGVPIGHWLAILILVALAYLLSWAFTSIGLFIIRMLWRKSAHEPTAGIVKAFVLPIRLYLAVWIFVASSQYVGISIIVRQSFSLITIIVGLVALLLLLWQLIDFITSFSEKRMTRRGNLAGVSAVLFLRRGAKTAIVVVGTILALDNLGFDVTAGIAALGIGGIALALGAQKTVENFVGSVTLIADQPIRVGDFCKVGETVGTVEQIGIRSTRIRTLARTIVTIPNGEFSSLRIENYAHRDMFWFHPILDLRYETTPDQIRYLLVELRSILYAHPKVDPEPARVRFVELGSASLKLEVFAYVRALDYNEFLEVQEDLILRMMDVVEASGTGFAFPSQTIYLAQDQGLSEEKMQKAESKVQEWRDNGNMHIPNFDQKEIKNLANSIPYPPKGSSQNPR